MLRNIISHGPPLNNLVRIVCHTHTHTEEPLIFRFFGKHCENVLPAGNIMHEDATAGKPSGKGIDKASINVSSFI